MERVVAFSLFCLGAIFGACLFMLGLLASDIFYSPINDIDIVNGDFSCSNLSLDKTASCLHEELSSWFKYNESNVYSYFPLRNIDWEVIKKEGGVCWHASEWYKNRAREIGYLSSTYQLLNPNGENHEIALIWNDEGYCVLDQKSSPKCNYVGGTI
jgi:hypothetical protein